MGVVEAGATCAIAARSLDTCECWRSGGGGCGALSAATLHRRELEVLLHEESGEYDGETDATAQRQVVLEHDEREEYAEHLSCGHDEREDERAEVLYGHEYEYLSDGAGCGQQEHVAENVRVLAEEGERVEQLALAYQAHERVGARVQVGGEHERYARHLVLGEQVVLPRAREAVADQVAEQADKTRHGGALGGGIGRCEVLDVAEDEYADGDEEDADVLVALVALAAHQPAGEHDEDALARLGQLLAREAHVLERLVLTPAAHHVRERRVRADEERRPVATRHDRVERVGRAPPERVRVAHEEHERAEQQTEQPIGEDEELAVFEFVHLGAGSGACHIRACHLIGE